MPCPHVSGDFCIRKFFYADTPSVHTCPPYTLGVSGDFCIRSPQWKFLYTLCIRIRVDARIRIFLYTLTSQYQNQSLSSLSTNQSRTQSPRAFWPAGERPERPWDNQSRTQSPRAFWPAGERPERLWDNRFELYF